MGRIEAVGSIIGNLTAVVAIVCLNKLLFSEYGFGFAPTFLLVLHQSTCTIASVMSQKCGDNNARKAAEERTSAIPKLDILVVAAPSALSNVFSTLSLKYNTVGTYQLLKLLNVPIVCASEYIWYHKTYDYSILTSLVIVLVGVSIATVNDVGFNLTGIVCGLISPVGAAINAMATKHVQTKFKVSGNDLLAATCYLNVIIMFPFMIVTDDLFQLEEWFSTADWFPVSLIAITCFTAWMCELSRVAIVEHTSPLTLTVVGHLKTIVIFFAGFLVFKAVADVRNSFGMIVALAGVILYSYLQMGSKYQSVPKRDGDDVEEGMAASSTSSSQELMIEPKPPSPTS